MKYALRYPVHRSSALRSTPLGCLKSQDARLVLNQKSHSAEAHFQQVAKLVDRIVFFDFYYWVKHSIHQTLIVKSERDSRTQETGLQFDSGLLAVSLTSEPAYLGLKSLRNPWQINGCFTLGSFFLAVNHQTSSGCGRTRFPASRACLETAVHSFQPL